MSGPNPQEAGDPGRNRTDNIQLRRLALYPVELRGHEKQFSTETPRVYRGSVNGMILLDATVNDKPAVLLLDTGSDFTLISPQASGLSTAKLRALTATKTAGAIGEYVKSRVDLRL